MSDLPPYYQDEAVKLYHGDCRTVLPRLDIHPALVITDPPYRSLDIDVIRGTTTRLVGGRNGRGGERIGSVNRGWFPTLGDEEITVSLAALRDLLIPTGALYVFCDVKTGLRILPGLNPANVLIWDKIHIGMGYNWRRTHEWVGYFPKPDHQLRSATLGDIIRCPSVDNKQHPTEKPLSVLYPLIVNSSDVGQLILDPFAGSGSILRAAKDLGRKAVGIEYEERYCEIAAARMRQEVLRYDASAAKDVDDPHCLTAGSGQLGLTGLAR